MSPKTARLTPELLRSAPRRSPGVPNLSGSTILFTTSEYDFDTHSRNCSLKALHVATGEIAELAVNQHISDPNWLDEDRFICLRAEQDGSTSFLLGDLTPTPRDLETYQALRRIGTIDAVARNLKIARLTPQCDGFALVLSAPSFPDGSLFTPIHASFKTRSSGRLYDGLFVRHWTRYRGKERNALWHAQLSIAGDGACELSTWTNLLVDTGLESPIGPLGGRECFDVRRDAVIYVARDPGLNPSFNTKCGVYVQSLESWRAGTTVRSRNPGVRRIEVQGFEGAATSPVFERDGERVAFLMRRRDRYEADKNQVFIVPDITAERLEAVRMFEDGEERVLEGAWDLSPESVAFTADGKGLVVVAEDEGRGRVFLIEGNGEGSFSVPRAITRNGTATDVRCLSEGRIFVSGSSLLDDSWYAIFDPLTDQNEALWSHSHSSHGAYFGLHSSQLSSIRTPASNPALTKEIHSFLLFPSSYTPTKTYPVAYLIHGGPHSAWKDAWNIRWNAALFAEQGFIVVLPNIAGSSGYGQAFTDASTGDWGGAPYEDLVGVFEFVGRNVGGADNERAVALGHSYGGFMINWIQGHDLGRQFKALVCHAGIFSSVGMLSTDELHFHFYEMDGPLWLSSPAPVPDKPGEAKLPLQTPASLTPDPHRGWSPSEHIHNWQTPQLVIHSARDFRVPITEGLAVFNVLQARGVPSRFLMFEDEGHWVLGEENARVWWRTVLDWVKGHVGLPGGADEDDRGEGGLSGEDEHEKRWVLVR